MSDLDKLIEAVEGGKATPLSFICLSPEEHRQGLRAYNGSLDAAKALHEALLDSGYHAEIWACCTRPRVKVVRVEEEHDGHEQVTEARSWLIAILKAYLAQQESKK